MVLVCLGLNKGEVMVKHCLFGLRRERLIKAHDSDVACVALSNNGKLLATASTNSMLFRVFATSDGRLLQELGKDSIRAEIYSLCFSSDAKWLAVSTNKGAVHVFSLNMGPRSIGTDGSEQDDGILPDYFSSGRSMAQFRVPEDMQHIVVFGQQKNTVEIIGMNGRFHRCKFDPMRSGEMTQMECHNFFQPDFAVGF
ncbi:UNVERIFIED_CONTAM: Autophagy-related protein 18a [Sesamum radiatum]|uniref:Autophagy-related protein 18a n=1 Tax=Sesamum radiatum TaxID=300843 RepID=A0AAW2S4Y2_SESRA